MNPTINIEMYVTFVTIAHIINVLMAKVIEDVVSFIVKTAVARICPACVKYVRRATGGGSASLSSS